MDLPVIRTSERSSFKQCPQQWWWGWHEGLRRPEDGDFSAADFGTGIHLALAEWYIPGRKRGRDPRDTWEQFIKDNRRVVVRTLDDDGIAKFENAADLGTIVLTEYLKEYGDDEDWEIIAPEQTFSVLIPDPDPYGIGRNGGPTKAVARFVGTIDLVFRRLSDGKIFILDTKTCQSIPMSFEWLEMDDQNAGYQAVATHTLREQGLIGPKETVRGMVYNYLRKAKPDDRPTDELGRSLNKDGSVSKRQPTKRFHREWIERTNTERKRTIKRIGEEVIWMNEVRSGRLPVIKRTNPNCKFCDFFDLCTTDEQGGDTEEFKKLAFTRHDPYADHRDGAINSKTSVANKIMTGVK